MLTSIARELWLDDLSEFDGADVPTLLAARAALVGGEPRRAFGLLTALNDDQAPADLMAAVSYTARRLDAGWWPGPTAAVADEAVPSDFPEPNAADAARQLLLTWVGSVVPESLSLRTIATGARRGSKAGARTILDSILLPRLTKRLALARQLNDPICVAHSVLLIMDVCRRAEAPDRAGEAIGDGGPTGVGEAIGDGEAFGDSGAIRADAASGTGGAQGGGETWATAGQALGAYQLALGDALLAPLQSPETQGFDLEARGEPPRIGDAAARAKAGQHYADALSTFESSSAPRGIAAVELRQAWLRQLDGDPTGAAAMLDTAADRFRSAGDGAGWALAKTHLVIAEIRAGRLAVTRPGPTRELASWGTGPGSRSFALGCAGIVHAVALDLRRAGEIESALAAFDLARRMCLALDDSQGALRVAGDLSELYKVLNSSGATIATLEEAITAALARHGGPDARDELDVLAWFEILQLLMALSTQITAELDVDSMLAIQHRLATLLQRTPGGPRALRPPDEDMLVGLERARRKLIELGEARVGPYGGGPDWAASQAAQIEMAVGSVCSAAAAAHVLALRARAEQAARLGSVDAADTDFAAALAAAGPISETLALSVLAMWGHIPELATRTRRFLSAQREVDPEFAAMLWVNARDYDEAAAVLTTAGTWAAPAQQSRWEPDWDPCGLRARIELGRGRPGQALDFALEGIARFERWFASLNSDAFRVAVLDDGTVRRVYQAAARARLEAGQDADAFVAAERPRSLALGLLVAEAMSDDPMLAPAVRAWRQAKAESEGAFDRRRAAWRLLDPTVHAETARAVEAAQARLDGASAALERASPGFLNRRPEPLPAVSAEQVGRCLDADTVVIEYLFADDELLVWTVDRASARGRRLELDSLITTGAISRLHAAWSGHPSPGHAAADDAALIAQTLLAPVHAELERHARVIVVPSGSINLVPFHALPFGGGLLGDDRIISQLPAASLIPRLTGFDRPRRDAPAVIIGDPATDPARGLRRLPGAGVEAATVARLWGGRPMIGADAHESAVRAALPGAPVVHFATHGLLDEQAPTLSALALAGRDELTVAELMGLGLDADLAVLSACDSGRGDVTQGGEVVGLARGLLAAGVRNAVVSLWPVDDTVGCLTMTAFAEQLAAGATVGSALATARRRIRATSADDRLDWYRELARQADAPVAAAGSRSRDARPEVAADVMLDDHPMWWAPFVHIGV